MVFISSPERVIRGIIMGFEQEKRAAICRLVFHLGAVEVNLRHLVRYYGRLLAHSGNSEGKTFILLRLLEDMVGIQIQQQPYSNNGGKHDKSGTVFHAREKGQQKNPKDDIVSHPNKGEWVSVPLLD